MKIDDIVGKYNRLLHETSTDNCAIRIEMWTNILSNGDADVVFTVCKIVNNKLVCSGNYTHLDHAITRYNFLNHTL